MTKKWGDNYLLFEIFLFKGIKSSPFFFFFYQIKVFFLLYYTNLRIFLLHAMRGKRVGERQ